MIQAADLTENKALPIYIISLVREAERRARCLAAMRARGLSFTFFDALDGAALSNAQIAEVYDPHKNRKAFKRGLSAPEIACYMSHRALWKRVADDAPPAAVILEDDFDADDALPGVLSAIGRLQFENGLIKLSARKRVSGNCVSDLGQGYRLIDPRRVPGQTLGYVISRKAASRLAAAAAPFGRPVDMDLKHWWEFDISILQVQPPVLHRQASLSTSAIELSRQAVKPSGGSGSLIRLARNLRYQLSYRAGLFRARAKRRAHAPGSPSE